MQVYKCGYCKRKQVTYAEQPHFPEHVKRQAAQICYRGIEHVGGGARSGRKRYHGEPLARKRGKLRVNGCAQ